MSGGGLSPFLHKKYEYLFNKFYDSNKNGVITHSDFVDIKKGLQKFRNWPDNDERLINCQISLNSAWNALKLGADFNQDQKVTLDEWFQYWAGFVQQSQHSVDGWPTEITWIKEYMRFWFDLLDASGDGFVDEDEYITVCRHFDVDENEAREAFKKINMPEVSIHGTKYHFTSACSSLILAFNKSQLMTLKLVQIDRDNFSRLWLEYMTSENDKSPGNFLFGKASWN